MRTYPKTIFLFLICGLSAKMAACSCSSPLVDLPIREIGLGVAEANYRSEKVELIFEGILLERTYDSTRTIRDYRMLFEVTDVYKGDCVDTIAVYTNHTGGGCGFWAKEGSYSIVFAAKDVDGTLFTYRSDCWPGANEGEQRERFQWFRAFLISITYKIDGHYRFSQKRVFWGPKNNDPRNNVPGVEYSIHNGKLEGAWFLYNWAGEIVESGMYKAGRRHGTWLVRQKEDRKDEIVSIAY